MADDVVPDRLDDAKHLAAAAGSAEGGIILWLIGEVERLRAESANAYELAETFRGKANAADDEIERLRGDVRSMELAYERGGGRGRALREREDER